MRLASAAGDIGTVMRLISQSSTLTPADYIKKTVGSILFTYYTYMDRYRTKPEDLEDLIDGLLFLDAKNYIMKLNQRELEESRSKSSRRGF